jgi:thiamine kinase-like enzyme
LDFDIEKQFANPDLAKLSQLANQTNGQLIFPDKADLLIKSLLENEEYKSIQKTIIKKNPLIDLTWLLILILVSLTSEWFIRKYNGLL